MFVKLMYFIDYKVSINEIPKSDAPITTILVLLLVLLIDSIFLLIIVSPKGDSASS